MKIQHIFFLILVTFCSTLSAQSFLSSDKKTMKKVLKRCEVVLRNFEPGTTITIERTGDDMEGHLETSLFMAGFEIVSHDVAVSSLDIKNEIDGNTQDISVSRSTTVKSVYVITVNSKLVPSLKCPMVVTSFNARIVDLANGGKLIGSFTFNGNMVNYACPSAIANAFALKLKEAEDAID